MGCFSVVSNRTANPVQEVPMTRRTSAYDRIAVALSRAGPTRGILIGGAILALTVAATASGQDVKPQAAQSPNAKTPTDSSASAAKPAAPLPKWFDVIAVNTFVSSGYLDNGNRPPTGTDRCPRF